MADIRIKDLATTASVTASDDFMAVDGVTNGTRKLSAATPAFLTSVTTPSLTAPASTDLTLTGGSTGASLVLGNTNTGASLGGGGLAVGSSASFVVGATAGVSTNAVGVPQISASSNTYSSIASIAHSTTDGNHGFIVTGKSRGTKASPTILADGDTFGEYSFVAYDGAAYRISAGIRGIISGTPGASDLPTRLSFSVAADGAGSTTERMNLMPTGNLLIGTTTDMTGSGGLKVASTSASTGSTSGAIITPGGIYAGAASVFGGSITAAGNIQSNAVFAANATTLYLRPNGLGVSSGQMSLETTGAATFAGAVTASGGLTASGTTANQFLVASANAGQIRALALQTGGVSRWLAYANTTAESGSNAGSNFQLAAYDDAGNAIDSPITINRVAGGTMTLSRPTTFSGAVAIGNTVATGIAVASTHKVTMVIGGVTYYLLASNV